MEKELLDLFSKIGIGNYTFGFIFLGFLFSIIYDIVLIIINYFLNKQYLIIDYEKLLYYFVDDENTYILSKKELSILYEACDNYKTRMKRKEKRNKFFQRIKGK